VNIVLYFISLFKSGGQYGGALPTQKRLGKGLISTGQQPTEDKGKSKKKSFFHRHSLMKLVDGR
jgi:hypothetical protein